MVYCMSLAQMTGTLCIIDGLSVIMLLIIGMFALIGWSLAMIMADI
jgi:hypothetical protein